MKKLKVLAWYGAFVSFTGYFREKKLLAYFMANLFNCIVPALVLFFCHGEVVGTACGLTFCVLYRLIPAPFDKISSDVISFNELKMYPLTFFEKVYLRISAKTVQVSELFFAVAVMLMLAQTMPWVEAVLLAVTFLVAISLFEELVYFGVYLVSASRLLSALYIVLCLLCGICAFGFGRYYSLSFVAGIIIAVSALCLSVALIAVLTVVPEGSITALKKARRVKTGGGVLTSRFLFKLKPNSAFWTLFYLELVEIFKIRLSSFISSLVYCIIFYALDSDAEYIYILMVYFAVEMVFTNGFNYFGLNDDKGASLLYARLKSGEIFRSKNTALAASTFLICALFTCGLGVAFDLGITKILLTLLASLFAILIEITVGSIVSVRHFHLTDSPKKYGIKNIIIMLLSMIFISVVSSLMFAGGVLTVAAIAFIIPVSLACAYFSLVDTKYLESYLTKNKKSMLANIA